MKTSLTSSKLLDVERLSQIYRGELSQKAAPELYEALVADDDTFDPFLSFHHNEEPLELELHESEAILGAILRQVPMPSSSALAKSSPSQTQSTPVFARWLQAWRLWLMPFAVGAAALALFPWMFKDKSFQVPDIIHKSSRDRGAFFAIDVYLAQRDAKVVQKAQPFRNKMTLHPEDALLFHFVNLRRGHLFLLREDAQGRLEALYPFDPQSSSVLAPGKITLKQGDQPMAYVLEPKMQGQQRFWLIHSQTPQTFPQDRASLSSAQRKLFERADHVTLFIRSR